MKKQKLAFYSKMQESHDPGASRCSAAGGGGGGSFTSLPVPASVIKEEDCGRDNKEPSPPEAEYLSARCVLFTYFQGDISTVVDEHFSRALSQSSGYAASGGNNNNNNKSARGGYPRYNESCWMECSECVRACKCTLRVCLL